MDPFFIGNPTAQLDDYIFQDLPDNCAVAAQLSILNQFFPGDIDLDDATYIAYQNGWYQPGGGTSPEDVGNLWEAFGIDCHRVYNADISQLAHELQMGRGVVVGVNADELWDQGPLATFWNWFCEQLGLDNALFTPANHAVTVIGIDISDPQNPMVILNDSGTPDGAGVLYPLDKFMDAWENSDFYYVATDQAIPEANWTSLNIAEYLGRGVDVNVTLATGSVEAGQMAGALVEGLINEVNWDLILSAI
jgi:hypothetical protein